MNIAVAGIAGLDVSDITMQRRHIVMSERCHMALQTKFSARLFEQTIILTSVRLMAFNAARTLNRISISRIMFIGEWPTLFRVAILANSIQIKGLVVIPSLYKPVTAKTGHVALEKRMI